MDLFNFFPGLEKSNEAYFGQESPLAQDLIKYTTKIKNLVSNVPDEKFKDKAFMKKLNSILIDFGEAIKLDINAEKVTFLFTPDKTVNAGAYPIYIRANTTVVDKDKGMTYLDLDKIADIEDIIITSEGYKYRNKKNKLLCVKINRGLFDAYDAMSISGILAHELGHCFQDGVFGTYKDIADIIFVNVQESCGNFISILRSHLPKFISGLTKVAGFRLLFIILSYLLCPQYIFLSGLFSGLGKRIMKQTYNPLLNKDNKTFRMKEQLKKMDNGDTKLTKQIHVNPVTDTLLFINKDNDRDKFIRDLKEQNEQEWEIYLENSKNLKPVKDEALTCWKKIVLKFDNMDIRIVKLLTLSRFTRKTYAKTTFYKRWEYFADIFAASYGFGPETYSVFAGVVDKSLDYINPVGLYWKYHIYKNYIEDADFDVHGTNKQRLQNIYTDLVHELQNNTELTSQQKKDLQKQIDDLNKIAQTVYDNRKIDGKSTLVKAYNRLIDDRIEGVSHDTEEQILKPIDDLCKEIYVGKHKKEVINSIESLYI